VEARLLESLDYLDDPALKREHRSVLDGCGTGRASIAMQKRWPKAMSRSISPCRCCSRRDIERSRAWLSTRSHARTRVRGCRAAAGRSSVDVLFSNLCLQWVEDLERCSSASAAC
jgi:malonyl-CoA O-methyltransferase